MRKCVTLISDVYLFKGFKPPTNGHQLVPQQRHYPKSLKSGPRFSSTGKWRNTFSYKKASGAYSKDGIKLKKFIYNDKNGIHPLTPKSDYGTGIRYRFSYAEANEGLHKPQKIFKKSKKGITVASSNVEGRTVASSNVKAAFTDVKSPIHQKLVSSIEKMIVDALGHETEHKTPVSSKHSNKATELEAKENGTSVKDKLHSTHVKKNKGNKLIEDAAKETPGGSSKGSKSKSKTDATKSNEGKSKTSERSEAVETAQKQEPVEPIEPVDTQSYTAGGGFCFCLIWCPPGTVFKGYCGRRRSYGFRRSMCCLGPYSDDDDDDADYDR